MIENVETKPNIGEIRYGKDIDGKCAKNKDKYIWTICELCNEGWWATYFNHRPPVKKCKKCCNLKVSRPISDPPKLGDICLGNRINKCPKMLYIWASCEYCKKERWGKYIRSQGGASKRCTSCVAIGHKVSPEVRAKMSVQKKGVNAREKSYMWKGGRFSSGRGYINVAFPANSPFREMGKKKNYIHEHRLVMAQYLGRCLESWEVVHHINGIRDDNRIENLRLLPSASEHISYTKMQQEIKELKERVTLLEAENALLSKVGIEVKGE